jgi:cadherin EGF LAG seven-pass G-type receptor 1
LKEQNIVTVQIHIRLIDANDNSPVFNQKRYQASVMENLRLDPPAPILQVHAEDLDEGNNGAVKYSITSGNEDGECTCYILSFNSSVFDRIAPVLLP